MRGVIIGTVCGHEPDFKVTQGGQTLLEFCVMETFLDRGKEKKNFWNCTLWGKRAEGLSKILKKGMEVTVFGEGRLNEWENGKNPVKRLECRADDVHLPKKEQGEKKDTPPTGKAEEKPAEPGPERFDEPFPF